MLGERNRSSAALAFSNREMFRLMHSTASGLPAGSRSTVLRERIFWPSQLSFSYGPILVSSVPSSNMSSRAASSPTSRLDRLLAM
ncbi:hypothetical protein D3C85_1653420 [compost metagenome]